MSEHLAHQFDLTVKMLGNATQVANAHLQEILF
jgi:hypothetical protein